MINKQISKSIPREKRNLINDYLNLLQDFWVSETRQQKFLDEAHVWASSNQSDRVLQAIFSRTRDASIEEYDLKMRCLAKGTLKIKK